MTNLIIIGAGGFGLEVAAYAEEAVRAGKLSLNLRGFLDDTKKPDTEHARYPVLGDTDGTIDATAVYVLAVGQPDARLALAEKLAKKGAKFASIIHPQSYVAASARIVSGCIIAPFAFVGPETHIGEHTLLNVYSSAGHESRIGRACVLSPYAGLHGAAVLGTGVFMGNGSCVTAKITVGDHAKISAGAVVYNDVPANAWAMGNPAAFKIQENASDFGAHQPRKVQG